VIPRTEGRLTRPDGDEVWFESAGEGPTLVLSHGLGGNGATWFQQVPAFAEHHQVVTWDQRGFGRSTSTAGRVGPEVAVEDLLALLDHLDVGSAHLVGQSMGGWAVLGAALRAPERVRSLVLACTTAGIPAVHVAPFDPSGIGPRGGTRPLGVHPAVGERLPEIDPARAYLYQALGTFGRRPSDDELARLLAETTYDPDALGMLEVPTLFICASRDPLMSPELIRDAATRLPQATVVELSDRGHSPYFEDPDAWNAVVGDFLRTVGA